MTYIINLLFLAPQDVLSSSKQPLKNNYRNDASQNRHLHYPPLQLPWTNAWYLIRTKTSHQPQMSLTFASIDCKPSDQGQHAFVARGHSFLPIFEAILGKSKIALMHCEVGHGTWRYVRCFSICKVSTIWHFFSFLQDQGKLERTSLHYCWKTCYYIISPCGSTLSNCDKPTAPIIPRVHNRLITQVDPRSCRMAETDSWIHAPLWEPYAGHSPLQNHARSVLRRSPSDYLFHPNRDDLSGLPSPAVSRSPSQVSQVFRRLPRRGDDAMAGRQVLELAKFKLLHNGGRTVGNLRCCLLLGKKHKGNSRCEKKA